VAPPLCSILPSGGMVAGRHGFEVPHFVVEAYLIAVSIADALQIAVPATCVQLCDNTVQARWLLSGDDPPGRPRTGSVGSLALCRSQAFLRNGNAGRWVNGLEHKAGRPSLADAGCQSLALKDVVEGDARPLFLYSDGSASPAT